jgi:hypothetical protein
MAITGSLLLMDIEVQSLCREQPIEQNAFSSPGGSFSEYDLQLRHSIT